jgi:hypothetical protein
MNSSCRSGLHARGLRRLRLDWPPHSLESGSKEDPYSGTAMVKKIRHDAQEAEKKEAQAVEESLQAFSAGAGKGKVATLSQHLDQVEDRAERHPVNRDEISANLHPVEADPDFVGVTWPIWR